GGWHAVFERHEEIFVELLLLATGLVFKAFALLDRIVLLGVGRRDFLPVDAALEDLHGRQVVGRQFGERDQFLERVGDKGRVDQSWLDELFEYSLGDFKIFVLMADFRAELERALASLSRRDVEPIGPSALPDDVFVFYASPGRGEVDRLCD